MFRDGLELQGIGNKPEPGEMAQWAKPLVAKVSCGGKHSCREMKGGGSYGPVRLEYSAETRLKLKKIKRELTSECCPQKPKGNGS